MIETGRKRKTDKRSSRTRKALTGALFKVMERKQFLKITVNDICRVAEVSRPTFYTYFDDKYALLRACIDRFYHEVLTDALSLGGTNRDIILCMLNHLDNNCKAFRNLFLGETNRELSNIIDTSFYQMNYDSLSMLETQDYVHTIPKELTAAFRAGGSILVMSLWVRDAFQIPKERIAEYLLYLNGNEDLVSSKHA